MAKRSKPTTGDVMEVVEEKVGPEITEPFLEDKPEPVQEVALEDQTPEVVEPTAEEQAASETDDEENVPFGKPLKCFLSPDEIAVKGAELSDLIQERDSKEDERKSLNKSLQGEIEAIAFQIHGLAKMIREKTETRMVQCQKRFVLEGNRVEVVRLDTGAVVEERAMTAEERQLRLV